MTAAPVTTTDARAREDGFERWSLLGGAAFVVLFVIGVILMVDSPDSSTLKYAAYFADSGNRDKINLGWAIAGVALLCLILFVTALRGVIRRLDGDGFLSSLAVIGGTIYIGVTIASIGLIDGIRTMSDDTYKHQVFYGVLHAADDAGYIIHATGSIGMAALILAISLTSLRTRLLLPTWLAWIGLVAALAAVFAVFFFTTMFWLLWLLVASIFVFLRRSPAAGEEGLRPR